MRYLPGDLKDPQETNAAEDGDAKWRHDLQLHQDGLHDAATHHETVEAVEQRHKISLQPQTVHLNQHLTREHRQQHLIGHIWRKKKKRKKNFWSYKPNYTNKLSEYNDLLILFYLYSIKFTTKTRYLMFKHKLYCFL